MLAAGPHAAARGRLPPGTPRSWALLLPARLNRQPLPSRLRLHQRDSAAQPPGKPARCSLSPRPCLQEPAGAAARSSRPRARVAAVGSGGGGRLCASHRGSEGNPERAAPQEPPPQDPPEAGWEISSAANPAEPSRGALGLHLVAVPCCRTASGYLSATSQLCLLPSCLLQPQRGPLGPFMAPNAPPAPLLLLSSGVQHHPHPGARRSIPNPSNPPPPPGDVLLVSATAGCLEPPLH